MAQGGIYIGPRFNAVEGIQSGHRFVRHDRQIGSTLYRIVKHGQVNLQYHSNANGIIVFRVDLNDHGEEVVTPVHVLGRPFPESSW